MSAELIELLVGAGIILRILFVYFHRSKKRIAEFQQMAEEIGSTCYPRFDSIPVNDRPEHPLDFPVAKADKRIRSPILVGITDSTVAMVFDYRTGEDVVQTGVVFRMDQRTLLQRFPDRSGETQVGDWFIEFGAGGWLILYQPRYRVKPGQLSGFLAQAASIAQLSSQKGSPQLTWLRPEENRFGIEVLDCRPITGGMTALTSDFNVASNFLKLRDASGEALWGQQPMDARSITCDLSYPAAPFQDGPLFKAQEMEDKWDIYMNEGFLYFSRSWTGSLIFRAKVRRDERTAQVEAIETGTTDGDEFVLRQVDYLIKSHVLGLEAPHPLPIQTVERTGQWFALYSFSLYGRKGFYGALSDAKPKLN